MSIPASAPAPARTRVAAPRPALRRQSVVRALARKALVVAVVTINCVALAWLWTIVQPRRYRATAIIAVSPVVETIPEGEQIRSVQALDERTIVATAAALVSTPVIRDAAIPRGQSGYDVRAAVLPNTNLLRVEVDGADPQRAAAIANRIPSLLGRQTRAVFRYYGTAVISPAAGGEVIRPRPARTIAAAFVGGVFLGMLVLWARARIRRLALA